MAETPTTQQNATSETSTPMQQPPKPTFARDADFFETYANNVTFESSVWDLKIIFGVFDQTPDLPPFKQLGAIRIPWQQAKLMAYMLAMNVAFHETSNGTINVPPAIAPSDIAKFVADMFPDDAKAKVMAERVNRIRAELGL